MSGSPIYLDGKMIGAYAYGWQFGSEPIAGVTPIQSMLDELARPLPISEPLPMPCRSARHGGRDPASTLRSIPARALLTRRRAARTILRDHARQLVARYAPNDRRRRSQAHARRDAAPARRHGRSHREGRARAPRAARARSGARRRRGQRSRSRRAHALRRRRRDRRADGARRHLGDGARHRHARRGRQARRLRAPHDERRRRLAAHRDRTRALDPGEPAAQLQARRSGAAARRAGQRSTGGDRGRLQERKRRAFPPPSRSRASTARRTRAGRSPSRTRNSCRRRSWRSPSAAPSRRPPPSGAT